MSISFKRLSCLLFSSLLVSCNAATNSSLNPAWQNPSQSASQDPKTHGTINYDDGFTWVGQLKKGLKHGQGVLTFPDGTKYTGTFTKGKLTGYGTMISPDGRKYVGHYKDGMRDGHGTATTINGTIAVGEFKSNKPHGNFTVTRPDGSKETQVWNMGKKISPKVIVPPQKQAVGQSQSTTTQKTPRRRWSKPIE